MQAGHQCKMMRARSRVGWDNKNQLTINQLWDNNGGKRMVDTLGDVHIIFVMATARYLFSSEMEFVHGRERCVEA